MAERDLWILGINAYDHDVAACLAKNGVIVVAIAKERVTRKKHDQGFYQEVVDYCLDAAGIKLDDVSHIVRNCYLMPVGDLEERLAHQHQPNQMPLREREQAAKSALFRANDPRIEDISHHLAHAYSAFAVSPFEEGVVMVVDGVGSYRCDVTEPLPERDDSDPLARESESHNSSRR
ncbi:MAG: carbamoyltransferase, partial [Planctomycetota bacterium]|nr:carbamoyltransferase [Planctomycetota bacterium]